MGWTVKISIFIFCLMFFLYFVFFGYLSATDYETVSSKQFDGCAGKLSIISSGVAMMILGGALLLQSILFLCDSGNKFDKTCFALIYTAWVFLSAYHMANSDFYFFISAAVLVFSYLMMKVRAVSRE